MVILKRYQYCEHCGKKLNVTDNGTKIEKYDTMTGEPLYVREYFLRCPDYIEPSPLYESSPSPHGFYIYHEPIEAP